MNYLNNVFELYNNEKIPMLGLGTWQIPNEIASSVVEIAIKNGYRHIDTANAYQNEEGVGEGIRKSKIKREDIYITSKIPAEIKTYEGAKAKIEESLTKLKVEYLDLMLIHCPKPWNEYSKPNMPNYNNENRAVWKALEEAYEEGKIKAIGVSNFSIEDLNNIINNCKIKPMVNQIIYHIGNINQELVDFCKENQILVEGYSPIATGRLLQNSNIEKIAMKYGKSVPQICLKFVLQKNILPLPKSTHEEYIIQNSLLDFDISLEDMEYLSNL